MELGKKWKLTYHTCVFFQSKFEPRKYNSIILFYSNFNRIDEDSISIHPLLSKEFKSPNDVIDLINETYTDYNKLKLWGEQISDEGWDYVPEWDYEK